MDLRGWRGRVTTQTDALRRMLGARRVAVVGASTDPPSSATSCCSRIIAGGFSGDIFPVNPRADEIARPAVLPERQRHPRARWTWS